MPSWYLNDAVSVERSAKYTFYRPSDARLAKIVPGDLVKLIFGFDSDDENSPAAERMWVTVDECDGAGGFVGKLSNEPYHIKDLKYQDVISFKSNHIISIDGSESTHHLDAEKIDMIEKFNARCFVTRRVLYDEQPVGVIYREEPDTEKDSGWRIMAGDEDESYMDDADNIFFVSLGAVLNQDDSYVHLLDAPVGSQYQRLDGSTVFELIAE